MVSVFNIIMTRYCITLKVNYCISILKYSTTNNINWTPVGLTRYYCLPFLFPEVAVVIIPQNFQILFCEMLKSNDSVESKCTAKEVQCTQVSLMVTLETT